VRSFGGKVRPRSVQSLARKLEEMLGDYETSKEKAEKLQEIVKDHYSWDTIVEKIERVYVDQYMKYSVEQPIFSYK
jgi:glycosyltransferase involved in cell wall biosynthesis